MWKNKKKKMKKTSNSWLNVSLRLLKVFFVIVFVMIEHFDIHAVMSQWINDKIWTEKTMYEGRISSKKMKDSIFLKFHTQNEMLILFSFVQHQAVSRP